MHLSLTHFRNELTAWFRKTSRPLPWRHSYNPYHVWISEIMLQQTQMERGVDYFNRWVERFPDITAVADASEQEVLKLWEGLGYYARARNLHAAAKEIRDFYNGELPCDHETLLSLPGVGPYTAAAISSIACNIDIPVVDANVLRVYARLFDIDSPVKSGRTRREIEGLAQEILPQGKARIFNQALMDFGGLICTPRNPMCGECPVAAHCLAYKRGTVEDRPIPQSGKQMVVIEMATGMLENEGLVFIQQRERDDIWGGLWEFPGGRLEAGESPEQAVVREYQEETGFTVEVCNRITTVIHYYTRYRVVLHCYGCRLLSSKRTPELTAARAYQWVRPEQLREYGFPAGHRKLLEYIAASRPELLTDPCRQ